jgi:predicted nucleic acid-binding Zn ribbon protein
MTSFDTSRVAFCYACGTEVNAGDAFCSQCGAQLRDLAPRSEESHRRRRYLLIGSLLTTVIALVIVVALALARDGSPFGSTTKSRGASSSSPGLGTAPTPPPTISTPSVSSTSTSLPASTEPSTTALPTVTVGSFVGVEPTSMVLSADGGDEVSNITWSSWSSAGAVGEGTQTVQHCVPDCADGTETTAPTTLTLSDPVGGQFRLLVQQTEGFPPDSFNLPVTFPGVTP